MLEGGEPLPVLYPLPQHFLPLVLNSSFCPFADVLTEDTAEAVGRAHGGSVTARTRAVLLCCGAGCLDCRAGQGRVLATDAVPGAFSLIIKASLPKVRLFELGDWYLCTSHVKCKNNLFPVIQQQR